MFFDLLVRVVHVVDDVLGDDSAFEWQKPRVSFVLVDIDQVLNDARQIVKIGQVSVELMIAREIFQNVGRHPNPRVAVLQTQV